MQVFSPVIITSDMINDIFRADYTMARIVHSGWLVTV